MSRVLEDSAGSKGVSDKPSEDHLGEYLVEKIEILAFGQVGL